MFEFEDNFKTGARLKVVGVGGCGGNAIDTMIRAGMEGVEFIAANTDAQALSVSMADIKIQLGHDLTKGLGAGANPEVGRNAAIESKEEIKELLDGADMVFITAGMGGGTGTGASAIVAQAAREIGALVVGIVTKPFTFEGGVKMRQADEGLESLRDIVDTVITVPNQRLLSVSSRNTTLTDAFKKADEVLHQAVRGISDVITVPGLVNVDFADVKTIMSSMGRALMGSGSANGESRAEEAAQKAICNPLLEDMSIHGARGVLINITGSSDMTLHEVSEVSTLIQEEADPDAHIIVGAVIDEMLQDELRVTVVATGFESQNEMQKTGSTDLEEVSPAMVIEDLERPAVMRRHARLDNPQVQPGAKANSDDAERIEFRRLSKVAGGGYDISDEDYYDTPTFLRKQAD